MSFLVIFYQFVILQTVPDNMPTMVTGLMFVALGLALFLQGYWWAALGGLIGAGIGAWAWWQSASGRRVAHTVAYTMHLQPLRAILFVIGLLTQVGMAVQVLF